MVEAYQAALYAICQQASDIILSHYKKNTDIVLKENNTPVTIADKESSALIEKALAALPGHYPILSEEGHMPSTEERASWQRYWLVDPLDGTRDFIAETDEFSINIALIDGEHPILGCLHIPVTGEHFFAVKNVGVWAGQPNQARPIRAGDAQSPTRCLVSRQHTNQVFRDKLESITTIDWHPCGSAYKFGKLASGEADLYLRKGPTCLWDTAAGQCILEAAGGAVTDRQGRPLTYGPERPFKNPPFIAYGDKSINWLERTKSI